MKNILFLVAILIAIIGLISSQETSRLIGTTTPCWELGMTDCINSWRCYWSYSSMRCH